VVNGGTMTPLKVLLIEDSEYDAERATQALADAGFTVTARRVASEGLLLRALHDDTWDLAIADYALHGLSGERALTVVREHDADLPFIFLSAQPGQDVAVAAMQRGADDYVRKSHLSQLSAAVTRALRQATVRRERTRTNQRLTYLAYHDAMTDLPNRALLDDRLRQAILAARRADNQPLALLLLDLDGFKEINDAFGHFAGDLVLQQVAVRLRRALRESDTIARLGGDEFAVLLPMTDADGATRAARKLLAALARPILIEGSSVAVRGSVGIAVFPDHASEGPELLHRADLAMYRAKNAGAGSVIYEATKDRATTHASLVNALRAGVNSGQFALDYQPVLDLRSNLVVGVEALLRWNHPQQGHLLPQDFIHVAEHTGDITQLTAFAIEQSLRDWIDPARGPFTAAVNLSPRSLYDSGLPARVRRILGELRVAPESLTLEITENLIMSDPEQSVRSLHALRDMGVRLMVDDFGTGYSSLSYLRRLPVHGLKIDQSFIIALANGEDDALVRSIIDLAHNLKLSVTAEGVETRDVWRRLIALNCDVAQGHFISRPGTVDQISRWISGRAIDLSANA
jgi:diguanylate cyclase (GGDEF)-like protein